MSVDQFVLVRRSTLQALKDAARHGEWLSETYGFPSHDDGMKWADALVEARDILAATELDTARPERRVDRDGG